MTLCETLFGRRARAPALRSRGARGNIAAAVALEPNPYAPPPAPDPSRCLVTDARDVPDDPPFAEHTVRAGRPPVDWRLSFHAERLVLAASGGPRVAFSRAEFLEHCDVFLGGIARVLAVDAPTRVVLPLAPAALVSLRTWLGPVLDAHLARSLGRRLRFALPLGLLVVLTSLPLGGAGADVLGLVFGLVLVAVAAAGALRKHRALYLADGAAWLLLALNNVARVATGAGVWFGLFAVLGVMFAVGSVRFYRFYGPPPA